jgi:hypothetical protein
MGLLSFMSEQSEGTKVKGIKKGNNFLKSIYGWGFMCLPVCLSMSTCVVDTYVNIEHNACFEKRTLSTIFYNGPRKENVSMQCFAKRILQDSIIRMCYSCLNH